MTNLIDNEDKSDLLLPKLCYEQISKSQDAQKWRTIVQIAQISEGPRIVKAAFLQLRDKEHVTEMRGQGFPFDDKG
ncbi:hypothetical protein LIER_28236 [Lithospermum erythrorhizon]|uniref:Uncharacterized protein n=1 Tax=Lithospermum erythrorhizon TaxID=34254 RepID=A0AAV3RIR3_LITER